MEAWKSIDPETADSYLLNKENREQNSRLAVIKELRDISLSVARLGFPRPLRVLELGCGNGERFGLAISHNLEIEWTGLDISDSLIQVARKRFPGGRWLVGAAECPEDVLASGLSRIFDVCLYCHVIEMIESPEESLKKARELATTTIIEFFEPPRRDSHRTEIRLLPETNLPYLRHQIGWDTYLTWIASAGYSSLMRRQTFGRYEVHVLN